MHMTKTQIAILVSGCILAFISGRLAVRAFLNLLLGGKLYGGDFL